MTNVYFLEFFDIAEKKLITVGIFSSLALAKEAVKGHESEHMLITKIPLDEKVATYSLIFSAYQDNLGSYDHWHWWPEYKKWKG